MKILNLFLTKKYHKARGILPDENPTDYVKKMMWQMDENDKICEHNLRAIDNRLILGLVVYAVIFLILVWRSCGH